MTKIKTIKKQHKKKRNRSAKQAKDLITGVFFGHERGFGFVAPEEAGTEDIFIPPESVHGALHGDKVSVRPRGWSRRSKKREGEIVQVLSRSEQPIIGTLERSGSIGFVSADEKKISTDILIRDGNFMNAREGDKVVVRLCEWKKPKRAPEGVIVDVLGRADDAGVDILSVIRQHGLKETFPEEVLLEAKRIPQEVPAHALEGRRDLRGEDIVTIDGEDAKDLDDAVQVKKCPGGNYLLGVHIADVGYYVPRGSALDKEAYHRGTSVYLVDRVIPMLPRELSNGICSLNPCQARLALSVFMEIDKKGRVVRHEFAESVIRTKERMTYGDVSRILEGDTALCARYQPLLAQFRLMKELRDVLKAKRRARGSIDFDFPEAKVILDDAGRAVDVCKYETGIAQSIIEEFMLVTNETVAEHMKKKKIPFVYRVHEPPSEDKYHEFTEFLKTLGFSLSKKAQEIRPRDFQKILYKLSGKPEERAVSTVMLRSLMKAKYSSENLGHFGLAAKYYCHFTSPIRRYPDLVIHRIIKARLHGERIKRKELEAFVEAAAQQASTCEVAAMEAERETADRKKAEYMASHIGEIYEGIVSSVTAFGMFVELPNTVEGLIRMVDLRGDYFLFDEKHHILIGERTKKTYRIGDSVRIRVARADAISAQIDFVLEEDCESQKEQEPQRRKAGKGHGKRAKRRAVGKKAQ